MRYENITRMDIVMYILHLGRDPTNAPFIFDIMVLFRIMNLHLFVKCLPSDFRSLGSLRFDLRSYLLCNDMHR
jgi:hypothetical protein